MQRGNNHLKTSSSLSARRRCRNAKRLANEGKQIQDEWYTAFSSMYRFLLYVPLSPLCTAFSTLLIPSNGIDK
ncbi:unnamed protein product [Sympodiomycopsis kandeliae]